MSFNLNEHRYVYKLAECAGITSATYDLEMYRKIADFVNSDPILSSLFTAKADTDSSSDTAHRVWLYGKDGKFGLVYGYYQSSSENNVITMIKATKTNFDTVGYSDGTKANSQLTINPLEMIITVFVGVFGTYVSFDYSGATKRAYYSTVNATGFDGNKIQFRLGWATDYTIGSSAAYTQSFVIGATTNGYSTPYDLDKVKTNVVCTRIELMSKAAVGYMADEAYYFSGPQLEVNAVYRIDDSYCVVMYDNSDGHQGILLKLE